MITTDLQAVNTQKKRNNLNRLFRFYHFKVSFYVKNAEWYYSSLNRTGTLYFTRTAFPRC